MIYMRIGIGNVFLLLVAACALGLVSVVLLTAALRKKK